MSNAEVIALFEKGVIPNYPRVPVAIARGEGSRVWDEDGKEYLDLFPGWGVSGLGHCHPAVVDAVREQAGLLFHMPNNFYSEPQGRFAAMLAERSGGMLSFFANSGAEANEGAIKLARLCKQPRYKIVTFENSFHGRTFAAISATGQPKYHAGFTPLVPGFAYAKLNDIDSVIAAVGEDTCAVMVEPVQGEGGVNPCTPEFLQALRRLCDEKDMLLIFDEVQTAPARLGTWFGFQHFGVRPDVLTSAKALAGGMPLGALLATPETASHLKPGTHASTFGGNAVACAAGAAVFEAIERENLLAGIEKTGAVIDELAGRLREKPGGVKEIRRVGLMVGIELEFAGADLVADCLDRGLILNCTHGNVLRLLPAFNVTRDELDEGFAILAECMAASLEKTAS